MAEILPIMEKCFYGTLSCYCGVTCKSKNNQEIFRKQLYSGSFKWTCKDLPKSQLGIDVENDYEPKYITIRGKGDILANLRKEAKKADKVFLATDRP